MNNDIIRAVSSTPIGAWTVPKIVGINGRMEHGKDTIANMIQARFGYVNIAFADHLRSICNMLFGIPFQFMTQKDLKAVPLVKAGNGYSLPFEHTNPEAIGKLLDSVLGYAYFTQSSTFSLGSHVSKGTKIGGSELSPAEIKRAVHTNLLKHVLVPMFNGKVFSAREIMQLIGTEVFRAADDAIWVWAWEQRARLATLVVCADMRFPNEFAKIKELGGLTVRVERPGYVSKTQTNTSHVSEIALDGHPFDLTIVNDGTFDDLWKRIVRAFEDYPNHHKEDVDNGYAKVLTA